MNILQVLKSIPIKTLSAATTLGLIGLSTVVVIGFFGQVCQLFELASHFRFLYLLAFLPALFVLLLLRKRKQFAVFLIFFVLNFIPILKLYLPTTHQVNSQNKKPVAELKVLQINLWGPRNPHHDRVLNLIKTTSPDVVGFSEVTGTWEQVLKAGLTDYKYRIIEKRFGGVALFSKYPMTSAKVCYFAYIKRPRVEASIDVNRHPVNVIFVHPVIPGPQYGIRNGELALIGNQAAKVKGPLIVFGDFNCSPWSYYFNRLMKTGKLIDSERGFGFCPTWPAIRLFPWITIDHCLVNRDFRVLDRKVERDIGSDHLPVFVRLSLIGRDGADQSISSISSGQ